MSAFVVFCQQTLNFRIDRHCRQPAMELLASDTEVSTGAAKPYALHDSGGFMPLRMACYVPHHKWK